MRVVAADRELRRKYPDRGQSPSSPTSDSSVTKQIADYLMHVPRAARSAMMSSRRTWRGRYQDRVKLVCLATAGTTKCLGTPLAAFGGILMRSILITVTLQPRGIMCKRPLSRGSRCVLTITLAKPQCASCLDVR